MKKLKPKNRLAILVPDWSAPKHVFAFTSFRQAFAQGDAYGGFNLATHVGDNLDTVESNRKQLIETLVLPSQPVWLQQTHSTTVLNLDEWQTATEVPQADAVFTSKKNTVCVVLTADCLPILISDREGLGIMAIHAGWRGLAEGIISQAIEKFTTALNINVTDCCAWLGPAISQKNFEVGSEVYNAFKDKSSDSNEAFLKKDNEKYLCDLYHLARLELKSLKVSEISGGDHCTYDQENEFYSYRRHCHQLQEVARNNANTNLPSFLRADDSKIKTFTQDCGRQATLIWLSDNN